MEQDADGAETAAIDGLISLWSENITVPFCLWTPGYGLTLWCTLGLLVGGTILVPQLQLQLQGRSQNFTLQGPQKLSAECARIEVPKAPTGLGLGGDVPSPTD